MRQTYRQQRRLLQHFNNNSKEAAQAASGKENMAEIEIRKAEASRNGILLWYYGIESYLDTATTADDYLALAERCAKLAAYCGGVAAEIARDGDKPLTPLTKANKKWVKKLK